jgi:hypothetical protein
MPRRTRKQIVCGPLLLSAADECGSEGCSSYEPAWVSSCGARPVRCSLRYDRQHTSTLTPYDNDQGNFSIRINRRACSASLDPAESFLT